MHEMIDMIAEEELTWLWPDLDLLTESEDSSIANHAWEAIERMWRKHVWAIARVRGCTFREPRILSCLGASGWRALCVTTLFLSLGCELGRRETYTRDPLLRDQRSTLTPHHFATFSVNIRGTVPTSTADSPKRTSLICQ